MVHDQLIPSVDDKVYILKEVAIDKPLFAFGNREIRHPKKAFLWVLGYTEKVRRKCNGNV